MDAESLEHIVPDGGYGWVIVLVAFMSIGISSIFSLDPFFTYLIDRFSHKPLMITILFAISNIIASFAVARRGLANGIAIAGGVGPLIYSPILSKLLSSIGHQWTISVFGLWGTILLNKNCVGTPSLWFVKRRGLANGIAIAGGVGPLIYSPILSKLLSSIGHQWTISVFGLWGTILLNKNNDLSSLSKKQQILDLSIFKIPEFVGLSLVSLFMSFGFFVPYYLIPLLLIWTFSTTLVPLLIFAMIYGMNAGGFVSLLSVVATDIVGYDQITNSIGYLYAIDIIGTTFGTPIAGALLDLSKSKATNQEGVEIYFLPIIISWAKLSSSPSLIETACCIVILILTLLDLA
ncbi:5836_t:CDS:2 [Entrophospora sp. SA101]|nr:5836_t:CDS:2 [Entrophospora sp. SA101]CAJ0840746.1 20220_t:CDS:2 [Entrophospora sp. SA101]